MFVVFKEVFFGLFLFFTIKGPVNSYFSPLFCFSLIFLGFFYVEKDRLYLLLKYMGCY